MSISLAHVCFSAPLTAKALSHALGMCQVLHLDEHPAHPGEGEMSRPLSIVECCEGLITIDPATRVMTMAYYDIAQYMQTHWDHLFSPKEKLMFANIPWLTFH